jgi:hypothetical protein
MQHNRKQACVDGKTSDDRVATQITTALRRQLAQYGTYSLDQVPHNVESSPANGVSHTAYKVTHPGCPEQRSARTIEAGAGVVCDQVRETPEMERSAKLVFRRLTEFSMRA